jgi:nicotinamide mononucleotide (NMN) deamidase PncC
MVRVITGAAGPDWASATTAIGTVAVAVVVVGVAFFGDLRAARRLREERKRSDDLLSEQRTLHAKEIAEERALLLRG